jgi:hypothetical protein
METYTVKVHTNGNGDRFWFQNDLLHRLDGPAFESANGDRQWWQNGKLHRLDGPAIEFASGDREWWIEGRFFTEEQFNKQTNKSTCENKTVIIDGVK